MIIGPARGCYMICGCYESIELGCYVIYSCYESTKLGCYVIYWCYGPYRLLSARAVRYRPL